MNHNANLSIAEMVRNRLPFLAQTPEMDSLMSSFIYEIMIELEPCFRVEEKPKDNNESNIGKEEKYEPIQRIIIADLTSCYIIMYLRALRSFGDGDIKEEFEMPTYLKRAKAGSVEVEWDKAVSGGFDNYDLDALYDQLRNSAIRKAFNIGCIIEWTDELLAMEMDRQVPLPLKVFNSGCGCVKTKIPERA